MHWSPLTELPYTTGPEYFKIYKGRWLLDNTFSYPKKILGFRQNDNRNIRIE